MRCDLTVTDREVHITYLLWSHLLEYEIGNKNLQRLNVLRWVNVTARVSSDSVELGLASRYSGSY